MSGLQIPIPHAVAAWSRKRRLHWIRLKRKHGFDPRPWSEGPWYVCETIFYQCPAREYIIPIFHTRTVSGMGEEHITSSPISEPVSVT